MPTGKPRKDSSSASFSNSDSASTSMHLATASAQAQPTDFLGSKPGLGTEAQLDEHDLKGILAHRFLSALLDDVIMDTAFEAHRKETKKRRSTCSICNSSSCRSIAGNSSSSTPQPKAQPSSQPSTQQHSTSDVAPDLSSLSSAVPQSLPAGSTGGDSLQQAGQSIAESNGNGSLPSSDDASSSVPTSSRDQNTSSPAVNGASVASAPQSPAAAAALSTPPPSLPTSTSAPPSIAKPTSNGTSHQAPTVSHSNAADYYSHNPFFECLVCSRQVSSNRYAPHLAKCLGLGSNSSSKTSSSRKGKASDASSAAAAFTKAQKVANALENRKKAMGMSPSLGNGSSARNSPARVDSDDETLKNSNGSSDSKKKTLGDSLGLGLNKFGKRAPSPNFGVGKGNWKRNKNNTATPPPSAGPQESNLDPGSSGMARSQSANSQFSSISSSQPFSHSPLNPNRYNNANDAKGPVSGGFDLGSKEQEQDNTSPSKGADPNGGLESNGTLRKGRNGAEEMEDFSDSPGPSSGSGLISHNGRNRKKEIREGYSDEESSMLSNSSSFSSGEGSSPSEPEDGSSDEEESSDGGNEEMDYDSPSESSQLHGRVGVTYGKSSRKKDKPPSNGMLERSRGSDGEFIGVDSASEQDDDDDDF